MRCSGIHIVKILLLLLSGLGASTTYAQQWNLSVAADATVSIHQAAVAADAQGNVFVTGSFKGLATFSSTVQISSNGSESDIFLAKYDPSGQALWAIAAGMSGEDAGTDIVLDDLGNVFLTGFYTDSLRMSANQSLTTGLGLRGLFVCKIDTGSRQALWLSGSAGTGNARGEAICLIDDQIYVAGEFESNALFDGISRNSLGKLDICVGRVDAGTGTWHWAISGGTAFDDYGYGLCTDSLDIYVAGAYASASFSLGTTNLNAGSNVNGFVAKLDATGMAIWSAPIAGTSFDVLAKSITSGNQRLYLAGSSAGADLLNFGNAPILSQSSSKVNENFWLAALRSVDGSPVWANIQGGGGNDVVSKLALLDPATLGCVGSVDLAITLGPSNLVAPDQEAFLYIVDANLGSGIVAVSGNGLDADMATDLVSDTRCGVYVVGDFSNTIQFGSLAPLYTSAQPAGFLSQYLRAGGNLQTSLAPRYDTLCLGDSSSLTVSGVFDGISWYASTDNAQTWTPLPMGNTPTINISPTVSTIYRAVTTLACEVKEDTAWVTVYTPPTVMILGLPDTVCASATAFNCNVSPNSPLGTISYISPAFTHLGNGVLQFEPSLAGSSGPAVLAYSYTDLHGCSNFTIDSVIVVAATALQISGIDSSYCASDSNTYLLTGSLAPLGQLSSSCSCLQINGAQATFVPAAAAPGQSIQIDYSYANGCNNVVSYTTVVYAPAMPAFVGLDSSYCIGAAADTIVSAWPNCNFSAGPWLQDLGNGAAVINPSILQNRDTLLAIDYLGHDSLGCAATAQLPVQLYASPEAIAGPLDSICPGDTLQIGSPAQPGWSYLWTEPAQGPFSTLAQPFIFPATSSSYLLTATNLAGCTGSDSLHVFVFPSPLADAGPDLSICQGDTITLGLPPSPGASYDWSSNLGFSSTLAQIQTSPLSNEKFQLLVQDSLGRCTQMDEVVVTVTLPVANVDAGPDQNILGSATGLAALLPSAGYGFWYCPSGLMSISDTLDPNATISNLLPGTYQLDWIVQNAPCPTLKDSILIVVQAAHYPSGFSPNGDGVNDLLVFRGLELQPDNHLQVFNRWGNIVYDQIGYANDWDGTANGQPLVDDTYYYVLNIQGLPSYSSYLVLAREAQN